MVSETPGSPIHQIRLFSKKSAFPLKKFSSRRKALFYLYFFLIVFVLKSLSTIRYCSRDFHRKFGITSDHLLIPMIDFAKFEVSSVYLF